MPAVVCCPPERIFLCAGLAKHSEYELECARSLERSVREIPMIACAEEQHPYVIHCRSQQHSGRRETAPNDADYRCDVHAPERNRAGVEVNQSSAASYNSHQAKRLILTAEANHDLAVNVR